MTDPVVIMGATFVCAAFASVAVIQWVKRRDVERTLNRRLVAYEGKLRELGFSPDRVYHDFEDMLAGNDDRGKAQEFEPDVREDGDGG